MGPEQDLGDPAASRAFEVTRSSVEPHRIAVSEVLAALRNVEQQSPDSWIASCPAHDEPWGELHIAWSADRGTRLYCSAGCTSGAVWEALGLVERR